MAKLPTKERNGRAKQTVFRGQNSPGKMRALPLLEQWVEVWVEDGITRTSLHPSNEELCKEAEKMDPPPELVYRRLNFRSGVPAEYMWTMPRKQALLYGGGGIQRMTVEQWLHVIALEKESGSEHIGPTGVGNLPRPNERGGCECPVCTINQGMLEELGYQV